MLESRHVIGLFGILLLFSALFFALGFKMGQSQTEGIALASPRNGVIDPLVTPRPLPGKHPSGGDVPSTPAPRTSETPSLKNNPGWDFHETESPVDHNSKIETSANSAPPPRSAPAVVKNTAAVSATRSKSSPAAPPAPAYALQVAALKSQADAVDLAKSLQKRKFPAFVFAAPG